MIKCNFAKSNSYCSHTIKEVMNVSSNLIDDLETLQTYEKAILSVVSLIRFFFYHID